MDFSKGGGEFNKRGKNRKGNGKYSVKYNLLQSENCKVKNKLNKQSKFIRQEE